MKDYRLALTVVTAMCAAYNAANGIWWLAGICAFAAGGQLYYLNKGV